MTDLYVGVDVSKEYLDVATSEGLSLLVSNDDTGQQQLVARLSAPAPAAVISAAKMPMIVITTSSSTKVNAARFCGSIVRVFRFRSMSQSL